MDQPSQLIRQYFTCQLVQLSRFANILTSPNFSHVQYLLQVIVSKLILVLPLPKDVTCWQVAIPKNTTSW